MIDFISVRIVRKALWYTCTITYPDREERFDIEAQTISRATFQVETRLGTKLCFLPYKDLADGEDLASILQADGPLIWVASPRSE